MAVIDKLFDGPIPGENFTSDVKNYPWHRPPEVSDLDAAIELASKRLTNPDLLPKIITMIEIGMPIVRIADTFVTAGIGAGKWTVDMGIMLAGPVTHMMIILAKGYGVKNYNTGLDKKKKLTTSVFFNKVKELNKKKLEKSKNVLSEQVPEIKQEAINMKRTGFLAMPAENAPQPSNSTPVSSSVEMIANEANNAEV